MTSSSPLSSSSLETFYFVMNMALQEGLEYKDIEHHLEQEISQRAENVRLINIYVRMCVCVFVCVCVCVNHHFLFDGAIGAL
mmetsp:Transcript_27174/g.43720  ORF Transcript_27174/g.43720 Transcript_27174/m.43720 type:complete len:82 (+) Transcript_27174:429-674(+)